MKNNLSAIISRLCVAILAFLGYSCEHTTGDMYGTPTGTWEIKGEVTEEASDVLPQATIKVTEPKINSSQYSIIEVRTNENGEYTASNEGWPEEALKVVCIPDDPGLEPDSTVVTLRYSGGDKKNHWDKGFAEATANFRLKKKEQ